MNQLHFNPVKTKEDAAIVLDLIVELATYEKLAHEVIATTDDLVDAILVKKVVRADLLTYNNQIIGYILYFYNFSTFTGRLGLYLEDLYIKPEYRQNGFGKQAFAYLINKANEENCGRMEWTCLNWNEPALQFYQSLGAIKMDEWTVHRLDQNKLSLFKKDND